MILHIFNPEHDLALAANLANFTAPHAGRQLRKDLGFLPALWAAPEDCVLVEDIPSAEKAFQRLTHRSFAHFIDKRHLERVSPHAILPWGWDLALRAFLLRQGIEATILPTEQEIGIIRELSHRRHAQHLLQVLQQPGTCGESQLAESPDDVVRLLGQWGRIVVKAPWSSSGRGVRFIENEVNAQQTGWLAHIIRQQGCVMVEPHYPKVMDFGMEFMSDGEGGVAYCGLSLFHTSNGAYTGNIIADEEEKIEMISHYVPDDLLEVVKRKICSSLSDLYRHHYKGPLGVDMMILARADRKGFLLHPCVEINLRRTMGHVALSIPNTSGYRQVMNIEYNENSYKFKIRKI